MALDLFEEWKLDETISTNKNNLVKIEKELPIFSLRHLDWILRPPSSSRGIKRSQRSITKVAVNNNVFVIGTSDGVILRWNIENSNETEEIELTKKPEDIIHNIFIDSTGHHVIIGLKNGDGYYLHSRSSKPKKLSKLHGVIESVAFDRVRATEANTKSFLIGTSTGKLYEVSMESNGKEKIFQLVFQLESSNSIASIYFETFSIPTPIDTTPVQSLPPSNTGLASGITSGITNTIGGAFSGGGPSSGSATASGNDDEPGQSTRIFVMCSTSNPTRLYHFIGGPSFSQLFQEYKTSETTSFIELPGGIDSPVLHCYSRRHQEVANSYALLTGYGVYHGSILLSKSITQISTDNILTESGMIAYTMPRNTSEKLLPISMAVTEFHYLILYPFALISQSRISGELQQTDDLLMLLSGGDNGEPLFICRDPVKNALWMITTTSIFQITTTNEDRTVWSMYLAKAVQSSDGRLFDTAHQFCKKEDDRKCVHQAQAIYYLNKGVMDKAATHFAVTSLPFDEVVLMLLSATQNPVNLNKKKQTKKNNNPPLPPSTGSNIFHIQPDVDISELDLYLSDEVTITALRIYLQEKLRILHVSAKSQRTMIATWLCEIYIHMIAIFDVKPNESKLLKPFKDFLRNNRGTLDPATTISLLVSRGPDFRPLLLFYCQIVGDYERVLSQYISEGKYADAITTLKSSPIEKVEGLIYKKAPVLMEHYPEAAVELFLEKKYLRVTNLLPALYRYSDVLDRQHALLASNPEASNTDRFVILDEDSYGKKVNYAIFYLEEIMKQHSNDLTLQYIDPSVQHTLLLLLAKYDSSDEFKLLQLLKPLIDVDNSNFDNTMILLDKNLLNYQYILRICQRYNRQQSCVYIYVLMNLYEKAVQLALTIDVNIAKSIAMQVFDEHLAKKLWLLIIDSILSKSSQNQSCIPEILNILQESNRLIRIEDILDKLPDFTEIDLFKEEIFSTLEDYVKRIDHMKEEMEELSNSAEAIENELTQVTTRGYGMKLHQKCECCDDNLIGKQFYLFPCGHGYHEECLVRRAPEFLENSNDIITVRSLVDQIRTVSTRAKDNDKRSMNQLEQLQNELDNYIAADCPLCGNYMIRSLGVSLISEQESIEAKSWDL